MKQIVTITGENLNIVTNSVEATEATGKKTKAQMRMEALKSAGVDVSNYYTLGADKLVRIEKGEAIPVDLDDVAVDAVGKKIVEGRIREQLEAFPSLGNRSDFRYAP